MDAAYFQLLKYQGALENPPLLVTCDTDRIVVHTHFANTPTRVIELTLEGLVEPDQLAVLRAVFYDPERLRPEKTIQAITEEAASSVSAIAQALRGRGVPPERVARFLDRVVFCMFAEDVGLLPNRIFTRVIENTQGKADRFRSLASELFEQMAHGGDFGADRLEHFNGNLFHATEALEITSEELKQLASVAALDWSNIDASIFGTLFERALDPDKRSQLGAHYTSREDIELLVEPVVMLPLRQQWSEVRTKFDSLVAGNPSTKNWKLARTIARTFLDQLSSLAVLDPACGSGNFLYVTLQKLKDLEKEVIVHTSAYFPFFPQVGPWQLRGIEINSYAHELAQMTVWIGHLQWHQRHGMPLEERPILRTMTNFEHKDAVIDIDGEATEPEWPEVDFIVSNPPPFLGDKFMRDRLGDRYVESLRSHYDGRVPGAADLCCYWFEKAREHLIAGRCRRVGLLATQSIRGGQSRQVLERIVADANIFFAVSDRDWILDGANVHVSMVGFDRGEEKRIELDGVDVTAINPDLTAGVNVTRAHALPMPASEFFQGPVRVGDFDVSHEDAIEWLRRPNPHGRPNSDVLRPTLNGSDNLKRSRDRWVVDFFRMPEEAARLYEGPFEYVRTHVQPTRSSNPRQGRRERWWQHGETGDAMRSALEGCSRMLVVTQTAKHLVFRWQPTIVHPEQTVIVFAREDDYFFGVLHSRVHAIWASAMGTQLEDRPRYTPTTCFETFPFPEVSESDRKAIASVASQLNKLREQWLNPPEWTVTESLIFPASAKGPWGGLVSDADETGVGTARWQRTVAKDEDSLRSLRARTLTNLYNQPPEWLTALHRSLDEAVFTAYGWSSDMPEEEVLDRLLRLNLALTSKVVPA